MFDRQAAVLLELQPHATGYGGKGRLHQWCGLPGGGRCPAAVGTGRGTTTGSDEPGGTGLSSRLQADALAVSASRGKVVRAEPISALHETGKIKFIGKFDDLEDELMNFTTTGYIGESSPNRADWFVWAFTELFPGIVEERNKHVDIDFEGWGQ